MATENLPGTYRIVDHAKVEFSTAMATWIPLAHDALVTTARRYHAVITYMELSEHVQDASGIRTRMLLANWIGKLLEEVARYAKANGEPPLTSLCVHQDGTIGAGYARAPKSTTDEPGNDIELYAAQHRLLCYRRLAVDLPADGGEPALTRAEQQRRTKKFGPEAAPRPMCPECNIELPPSRLCDCAL